MVSLYVSNVGAGQTRFLSLEHWRGVRPMTHLHTQLGRQQQEEEKEEEDSDPTTQSHYSKICLLNSLHRICDVLVFKVTRPQ